MTPDMNAVTQATQVPVSVDRHGTRFWRRFTSYAHARYLRDIPVVLAEIEPAASAFPLVFRASPGGVIPVALLHLVRGQPTPFVTEDGRWRGTYVPSALRAHPFSTTATEDGDEMALLVDEASGLVTDDPEDEAFFTEDGHPSETLQQVVSFFRNRETSLRGTYAACAVLKAADLLIDLPPLPGMSEEDASGLLAVDPDRLSALSDSALPDLWRSDALKLAVAHRVSLHHAAWLARALRAGTDNALKPRPAPPPASENLSGFLDALADAQDLDSAGRP